MLSFYSKVFDKLMYNKLYNFIEANDILYSHQYGFRRGHSTQQAIITLIDKMTKSVKSDDFVISVFIDLKKAFDCVPTNIMLAKLQACDIHHYNTRQNHHLRGSRPTCKTVVNSFTNRSFQIWNAISSKVNINVSLYKFKYNVKLFLLENELMITYHY